MADTAELNAILSTTKILSASHDTGYRVSYANAFGDTVYRSPRAIVNSTGIFHSKQVLSISVLSSISTGVFLKGTRVGATGVPDPVPGCGSLIFSKVCSSAHIVTLGL